MKKTSLTFLLTLINVLTCFSQIDWKNYSYEPKCSDTGPIYYTTRKIEVFDEMSSQSAVRMDIDAGEAIEVTNSFFGDQGWWEICYKGKNGWAKKAYLARKKTTQKKTEPVKEDNSSENTIQSSDNNPDVGFDPFLAKATGVVNFRATPSKTGQVLRQLQTGSQLYIFSNTDANGFYKSIDIKTGKIGWVSKSMVKWSGEAKVSSGGGFQSTGKTSDYNPAVKITNKSSYKITLVVGSETYYLSPNSTETKYISPSKLYFIATAPGVIPTSGYQSFEAYQGYQWEFWVETRQH